MFPFAFLLLTVYSLNQTIKSRRWRAFCDGSYPTISSIVSLPKDIYDGDLFHSEVRISSSRHSLQRY